MLRRKFVEMNPTLRDSVQQIAACQQLCADKACMVQITKGTQARPPR